MGQAKTGQVGDGFSAVIAAIATDINPFRKIGLNGVAGIKAVLFRWMGIRQSGCRHFCGLGKRKFLP
jgi:hypothetical protein